MLIEKILQNCAQNGGKAAIIDSHSGDTISYSSLGLAIESSAENFEHQDIHVIASIGEPDMKSLPGCLSIGLRGGTWIPLADTSQLEFLKTNLVGHTNLHVIDSRLNKSYTLPLHSTQATPKPNAFLITFSSGTTGNAKGVIIDQPTKFARTQQAIDLFGTTQNDVFLSSSPVHHSLGQRHLFMSLLSGATLIRNVPFTSEGWFSSVSRYRPTFAIPVSTQVKLLEHRLLDFKKALRSFRILAMSSAPCSPELKHFLFTQDIELWETYGCTETAFATAIKLDDSSHIDHVGSPVSGVEIQIDEQSSEIKIKTPYLCQGYLAQDALFQSSFDKKGFFKSGDKGNWSGPHVQFNGRLGLEFTVAGKKVNPIEMEAKLTAVDGVQSAVVAPVENSIFENTVGLFYEVSQSHCKNPSAVKHDLFQWAIANLEKHEVPTHLVEITEWPTLPNGKLDRQSLIKKMKRGY